VLELFLRLEKERPEAYGPGTKQLAILLDLTSEWLTGKSVSDRRPAPHQSPGMQSFTDWHTCRAVREDLLVAVGPLKGGHA
jgi:hypothetical protein